MLIKSPRHTKADLELWRSHAESDILHSCDMRPKIESAVRGLHEFAESGGIDYCAVSWGKDSMVVAHMLWLLDRSVPLVHLRPTNHNPDCDQVRDTYFDIYYGQPYHERPVDYSGIDRIGTVSHELNKATDRQWYAAISSVSEQFGPRVVMGLRADESSGRRFRALKFGINSSSTCAPIAFFNCSDVFGYLAANELPVHPAYAMLGGGRWKRENIRVAEIGDTHGTGMGRREWESEYYGDYLARIETRK